MNTYTYKYLFTKKDVDGISCSLVTGTEADHERAMFQLQSDPSVILALREYVCTYENGKIGLTEKVKIKKEDDNNEEKTCN